MNLKHKLAYIALGGIIAICGMLSTTFFSTPITAQNDGVFDTIIARHLYIVDDDGKEMVVLFSDGYGGGVFVQDKAEKPMVGLRSIDGGYVSVLDKAGKKMVGLGSGDNGGYVFLHDKAEKIVVGLGSADGGFVSVLDKAGNVKRLD